MPFFSLMTKYLFALVAICVISAAHGAADNKPTGTGRVYGVLSLIGDRLDIVVALLPAGASMDPNRRESILVEEAVFDDTVLGAMVAAVRKVTPNAELASLNTRSPVLFEKHRTLFEESANTIAIPEAIRDALKAQGATHLFLITKRRDEASALLDDVIIEGRGKLEGLGFYLDSAIETRDAASGRTGRGYLAPYAFFDIRLIDLANSTVVARRKVVDAWPVSIGVSAAGAAGMWGALSAGNKVRLVNELIKREISRLVPEMLR